MVRFIPGTSEEKAAYINLYSYLNSRSRCGVVEHKDRNIKDFYIVPLASHSKIPSVLLPFDGPGTHTLYLQLFLEWKNGWGGVRIGAGRIVTCERLRW